MSLLRVALIGSRGIPAVYGGYETLMEELAVRLKERGFQVTVYCRSHYTSRQSKEHRGVELVVLPTVRSKYLDTPVHTLLSCLHAAARGYDAALIVNSANALFLPLLRSTGIPVALHVDGIERRRGKWGGLGRLVYALSERLATMWPDRLITDAESIRCYYVDRYGADSEVIRYGVEPQPLPPGEMLDRLRLERRRYFLYVSRFEPENNPHRVAAAYAAVKGDLPLVMVGGAPYASKFIRSFTEKADCRILFPGPIYGVGYRELLSNALAYIQATEVGGTHPALVEAMGYGNCVVANDNPENREVAGDAALYFRVEDMPSLADTLESILAEPERAERLGERASERARKLYTWDGVADSYEEVFRALAERRP